MRWMKGACIAASHGSRNGVDAPSCRYRFMVHPTSCLRVSIGPGAHRCVLLSYRQFCIPTGKPTNVSRIGSATCSFYRNNGTETPTESAANWRFRPCKCGRSEYNSSTECAVDAPNSAGKRGAFPDSSPAIRHETFGCARTSPLPKGSSMRSKEREAAIRHCVREGFDANTTIRTDNADAAHLQWLPPLDTRRYTDPRGHG